MFHFQMCNEISCFSADEILLAQKIETLAKAGFPLSICKVQEVAYDYAKSN